MNDDHNQINANYIYDIKPAFRISPIFLLIVFIMIVTGLLAYFNQTGVRFWVFLFVTSGWIVSLSLHEFGHAIIAFRGGDTSVAEKGYLNLNPLKYTNLFMSIVLPVVFLMMGGIGFPGGAVYINMGAIKDKTQRSLVSAAGPIATAGFALILLIPFFLGMDKSSDVVHNVFWSGLALLAFLQITALIFNLLPVPGLDGFGIIEPFLPDEWMIKLRKIGGLFILAIFFLLFNDTPFRDVFWYSVKRITDFVELDIQLISNGFKLFQF
ncbi:MAG TPA: site-2 protease family protein, partial [Caldithrix sp.]|nr:site-2 protease family protein [Caldithrix sp.]